MEEHSAVLDIERGQLGNIRPSFWQTDTSVSNKSWGYIQNDTFKSPQFIIHQLADIVSKNGCLLLNIGPKSDGTIPDDVQGNTPGGWGVARGERRRDLWHASLGEVWRRPHANCRWFVS
jgi:hypothetical protein